MGSQYRVAVYGHKSIPSREGGIEVVVQELCTRLVNLGHTVTCMNRGGNHDAFQQEDDCVQNGYYQGVRIVKVPTIDRGGLAAVSSSFFAAIRAALGPYDIVHIHAEGPAAFCLLPKLFGKRVVVTIHGLDWQRDKWHGFARRYIHFGEEMAARHAHALIVLSQNMKEYFQSAYDRDAVYISNGVEPAAHAEAHEITRRYGLVSDSYILYLGRLVPEKCPDLLVRAFKSVKTDKRLVIAGPLFDADEYHRQLRELAAEDGRILFAGFVNGAVLQELFSNAYVYVLPSKLEGMPLSLLEAMSYGCCCVAADIPECREALGSQGILVDPGDERQLQETLQRLVDNPAQVEGQRKAIYEVVLAKRSWDEVAGQTHELYKRVMDAK